MSPAGTAHRGWRSLRVTPVLLPTALGLGAALGAGRLTIPCWFRALTGLDCPFCGGSRAVGALLHADLPGALRLNAFAVLVLLPGLAALLVATARWEMDRTRRVWPSGWPGRLTAAGLTALTAAWWMLRNLPFPPFAALRG